MEFAWQLLYYVISIVHLIKNNLSEWILGWYLSDRKKCPSLNANNKFLAKSAIELAAMIRNKEITSYELVKACINRINEVSYLFNIFFFRHQKTDEKFIVFRLIKYLMLS